MNPVDLLNPNYLIKKRGRIWPYLKYNYFRRPLRNFQRFSVSCGFPLTDGDKRLAALKGVHKGQRAFVIGNGPSLQLSDLEKLCGEITFASNKIYLIYPRTSWRPTYYSVEDMSFAKRYWALLNDLKEQFKFFPEHFNYSLPQIENAIYYHLRWEKFPIKEFNYPEPPRFSTNALSHIYAGCTISYVLIQLAWFMGIRELYLIGMDFKYEVPPNIQKEGGAFISNGQERNHFVSNYLTPGDLWSIPRVHMMKKAMEAARTAFQENGGKIFNATRGGNLEVFPRIEFDELF